MPITADADFAIDGSAVRFKSSGCKIYCPFSCDKDDVTAVDVQVWDSAGEVFYASTTMRFSEAELEGETGAGAGEFSNMKSVVEQSVVGVLDALSANSAVTFTIV